MLTDAEKYFLPIDQGGDRLRQIVKSIDNFKSNNRRYADRASRALVINKISILPDGTTASVQTSEIWHQPILEDKNGTEVTLDQPVDKLNLYTAVQFYILRKESDKWYIQSNPAPATQ